MACHGIYGREHRFFFPDPFNWHAVNHYERCNSCLPDMLLTVDVEERASSVESKELEWPLARRRCVRDPTPNGCNGFGAVKPDSLEAVTVAVFGGIAEAPVSIPHNPVCHGLNADDLNDKKQ